MIKEIIRLKFEFNLSTRLIARSVGCTKSSIAIILRICRIHEFNYDSIAKYNDNELQQLFFPKEINSSEIILPN
ncbi:MAG: hypothetical protein ACPKM0_12575 [Pleomorphochaeta sp.]